MEYRRGKSITFETREEHAAWARDLADGRRCAFCWEPLESADRQHLSPVADQAPSYAHRACADARLAAVLGERN